MLKVEVCGWKFGKLPTAHGAGFELYSPQKVSIDVNDQLELDLGIKIEFPVNCYGKIESKLCMAKKNIQTFGGIIDNCSNITVLLRNVSNQKYEIKVGDTVGQLLILPYLSLSIEEVNRVTPESN